MQQSFSNKELSDFLLKVLDRNYYCRYKNTPAIEDVLRIFSENAEQSGWDIDGILKGSLTGIGDNNLRQLFRRFLIAKKLGVRPFDPEGRGIPASIIYASDSCVLINVRRLEEIDHNPVRLTSTIILTPTGEVKMPEGKIVIFPNKVRGFVARDIVTRKMGFFSLTGDEILPYIFDEVTAKSYLPPIASFYGHEFELSIHEDMVRSSAFLIGVGRAFAFCYGTGQTAVLSIVRERMTVEDVSPGVSRILDNEEDDRAAKAVLAELKGILEHTHGITAISEING